MYFLIMAAHDPITNEEFSSILFLSLGNIELLLKGIQTQTKDGNITAVDSTPVTAERAGGFGLLPTRRWVT